MENEIEIVNVDISNNLTVMEKNEEKWLFLRNFMEVIDNIDSPQKLLAYLTMEFSFVLFFSTLISKIDNIENLKYLLNIICRCYNICITFLSKFNNKYTRSIRNIEASFQFLLVFKYK